MNKEYKINCQECKKKSVHEIVTWSRLRGVRLQCKKCHTLKKNYIKLYNLEKNETR